MRCSKNNFARYLLTGQMTQNTLRGPNNILNAFNLNQLQADTTHLPLNPTLFIRKNLYSAMCNIRQSLKASLHAFTSSTKFIEKWLQELILTCSSLL